MRLVVFVFVALFTWIVQRCWVCQNIDEKCTVLFTLIIP